LATISRAAAVFNGAMQMSTSLYLLAQNIQLKEVDRHWRAENGEKFVED
jgi:hypothetical protein